MRGLLMGTAAALGLAAAASGQVSLGVGIRGSGVSIGVNLNAYPDMVPVPGYPVYYDPRGSLNDFFYDGMYWVFEDDNWYASSWYNGPWDLIDPNSVPLFVLRIPVRYYRQPPDFFRGWASDAAPRWNEHWGRDWTRKHGQWDEWDRASAPGPAPLPGYQRRYAGSQYPTAPAQRDTIRASSYRYAPREAVTQQVWHRGQATGSPREEPVLRPPGIAQGGAVKVAPRAPAPPPDARAHAQRVSPGAPVQSFVPQRQDPPGRQVRERAGPQDEAPRPSPLAVPREARSPQGPATRQPNPQPPAGRQGDSGTSPDRRQGRAPTGDADRREGQGSERDAERR